MSTLTANQNHNSRKTNRIFSTLLSKLILSLLALVAIAMLVGGITVISQLQQETAIRDVIDLDIQFTLSEAEVLEEVALMRITQNYFVLLARQEGVDIAKEYRFPEWEAEVARVHRHFSEKETPKLYAPAEEDSREIAVQLLFAESEAAFLESIEILTKLGTVDSGQVGLLNQSGFALGELVHQINIPDLTLGFLSIISLETQYLILNDTAAAEQAANQLNAIQQMLESPIGLPPNIQQALLDGVIAHQQAFDAVTITVNELTVSTLKHQAALNSFGTHYEDKLNTTFNHTQKAREGVLTMITRNLGLTLILTLGGVVIGTLLSHQLSIRLTGQSEALLTLFNSLEHEEIDTRADIISHDELGRVAQKLNQVLDERNNLIQTNNKRDNLELSINNLIHDMENVATGNLTHDADIPSDITSSIANSFNIMLYQLRDIIGDVQSASHYLTSSTGQIQKTTSQLILDSEVQSGQIVDMTSAIDEMSVSIQQISTASSHSIDICERASSKAEQGSESVQEIVGNLHNIHLQTNKTADSIEQLGKDAEELTIIVQLIEAVTERTRVLALNASIQATASDKSGLGFNAVAKQVESLASQSAIATLAISEQIKLIQEQIKFAYSTVSNMQTEVDQGLYLANEAGGQLLNIEKVSAELTEHAQLITQATQQQLHRSKGIAHSMGDINTISLKITAVTRDTNTSIDSLATVADNLKASVAYFEIN